MESITKMIGFDLKMSSNNPVHVYEKAMSEDTQSDEATEYLIRHETDQTISPRRRRCIWIGLGISCFLNIALIWFIAYMYAQRGPSNPIFPQMLYSPLQDVLRYKSVLFASGFGATQQTKYMGNTSSADAAWKSLYPQTVVRIPKSSADRMVNRTAAIAGDEAHYAVLVSVFHELHCLDAARRHYFGRTAGFDADPAVNAAMFSDAHMDHCFDSLRQTLMCGADVTPIVWRWNERLSQTQGYLNVPHTCRDYDAILEWAGRPEHDIGDWDLYRKPANLD